MLSGSLVPGARPVERSPSSAVTPAEPIGANLVDTGSLQPTAEALEWQRRADAWARTAERDNRHASDPANETQRGSTGNFLPPSEDAGWPPEDGGRHAAAPGQEIPTPHRRGSEGGRLDLNAARSEPEQDPVRSRRFPAAPARADRQARHAGGQHLVDDDDRWYRNAECPANKDQSRIGRQWTSKAGPPLPTGTARTFHADAGRPASSNQAGEILPDSEKSTPRRPSRHSWYDQPTSVWPSPWRRTGKQPNSLSIEIPVGAPTATRTTRPVCYRRSCCQRSVTSQPGPAAGPPTRLPPDRLSSRSAPLSKPSPCHWTTVATTPAHAGARPASGRLSCPEPSSPRCGNRASTMSPRSTGSAQGFSRTTVRRGGPTPPAVVPATTTPITVTGMNRCTPGAPNQTLVSGPAIQTPGNGAGTRRIRACRHGAARRPRGGESRTTMDDLAHLATSIHPDGGRGTTRSGPAMARREVGWPRTKAPRRPPPRVHHRRAAVVDRGRHRRAFPLSSLPQNHGGPAHRLLRHRSHYRRGGARRRHAQRQGLPAVRVSAEGGTC